jgi:hypothetical protein
MSQAISKVASKAAKSVNSQNREEVSTTATSRTTIAHTDETVATIHNINQGRSLNLLFYRLYNKYEGGLYLESLRFDVIPGVEVIAGSGVYESKSYSLEELPRLIEAFRAAHLPFAIRDEDAYTERLLTSIETLLHTEYTVDGGTAVSTTRTRAAGTRSKPPAEVPSLSVARVAFPSSVVLIQDAGTPDPRARMAELSKTLQQAVIHSDIPIAPQELLVASSGLYLDAVVGSQPSTEPYSEQMRAQEVRMRAAEVAVKQSESAYQQAMALRLTQLQPTNGANCLTGALPSSDRMHLTLSLRMPLLPGEWHLCVDGKENEPIGTMDIGGHIITFSWNQPQLWLFPENLLLSRIALVNEQGDTIVYPSQSHQFSKS